MSKTAAKYYMNYHAVRRKTWLERLLDKLRVIADWYCGVGTE